jgi:hypothetical protein
MKRQVDYMDEQWFPLILANFIWVRKPDEKVTRVGMDETTGRLHG